MTKLDRRLQRTREILQRSLIDLMNKSNYDAITIQDIVTRANLGRTTFYLHYNSKDELLLSCHEAMVREFRIGLLHPLSKEELLSPEMPTGWKMAYRHLEEARAWSSSVFQGKASLVLLRQLRDWNAQQMEANLQAAFATFESNIPLDVLSNYLAGAQIALLHWWLEKRRPHTLEELGQRLHQLQRAAIRDAFGF